MERARDFIIKPTGRPIIRFIQKSDLKELVNLCKLHAIFEESEYDSTDKAWKLNKHLFSDNPITYCLVVEQEEELIGYATYTKQFSTWDASFYVYMDCLFLKEEARGNGIGESLVNHIKIEATKLSCNLIQWQTPSFNKRAIKFYNRIGGVSKSKERYFLKTNSY